MAQNLRDGAASAGTRATIEDVAALANVSVATVSRALRGLPNVAEGTRQRVADAAEQLSYRPDPNASRLAAGRTMTIGMAVPIVGQWYYAQVVAGAATSLNAAGYDLLLMSPKSGDARRSFIEECALIQKRVDGLILVDLHLDADEVEALQSANTVVAAVGDRYPAFSSVTIDNRAAAARATSALIELGHRRIGFIGIRPVHSREFELEFSVPEDRLNGYRDALAAAGIPNDKALESWGEFEVDHGVAGIIRAGGLAMEQLLGLGNPPTAVFAMSDEAAFGARRVVREHDMLVPDDVSIIGFDDHEVADVLGLSTVRQPVLAAGIHAAEQVVAGLTDVSDVRHTVLDVQLVLRHSTSSPR